MNKKMTIEQSAKYLGVTKEAIYNRIRRNKLECIEENGIKYILVNDEAPLVKKRAVNSNLEYISSLEKRVLQLEEKVVTLELKNEKLRDEKEDLLVESKEALKSFYKERDEQLKTILTLANNQFIGNTQKESIKSIDVIDIKSVKKKKKNKSKKREPLKGFLDL